MVAGDSTTIAVAGTKNTAVSFSKVVETTQTDTGVGIRKGVMIATESSKDVTPTMTTVLQATTRTVTFPETSATGVLNV